MSMLTFVEPLLGKQENLKAPLSKANGAGWKAGVALALCVLSVGGICYHQLCLEHESNVTVQLDAPDLHAGGRDTVQDFMSVPTEQNLPPDVAVQTRKEVVKA